MCDLDDYLDDNCSMIQSLIFLIIAKKDYKYSMLRKIVREILAIPIFIVAS